MRTIGVCSHTVVIVSITLMLILSACQGTSNAVTSPTSILQLPAEATATLAPPTATTAPTQIPVDTAVAGPVSATMDVNGVAQDVASQVIEAVAPGSDRPWWEVMPQHSVLTLLGYPITNHVREPKIYIFPVEDLAVNEVAGKAEKDLHDLLLNQQVGEQMPFLPLSSDTQMLYAQVKYLDFKNGTGVRYLTQYGNGIVPINNNELFYTYQGLTSDGQHYVAVVLPVNLNGLPAYPNDTDNLPLEFTSDHAAYITSIVNRLNLELESAYTPDLNLLDAMVRSIEVK